ncbi:hypothetical protein CAOG_02763 [Capsaspora owczarzaki ATCC 30864]|uniref:Uncharacterized protein n=1 Tax=Capsaspora owczarzaki (strain ATCC 30864) TaxID=595528 RepID=A0A0D2WLW5_CAPO3|nr:hypothetical protein CAOG_02763 [Capsaspora owczarzaki ATCC 30864]KJE91655.1 hypothetical protein CAOG_002763 [Capsaspora owczarzaki ATCC 30864]|eukprot:XP_004349516.2 hypothetical protein CAOG_02763 [Capsaspora owczarzaki ATCC 30864]
MASVADKIAAANALRLAGNELFQQNDLHRAARKYHEAILTVKGLDAKGGFASLLGVPGVPALSADYTSAINEMLINCYSNLTVCASKSMRWEKCIQYCDKIIALDKSHTKAHFRRGQAHLRLGFLDRAERDLKVAAANEPNDSAIQRELQLLHERQKEADREQKAFYSDMFQRMKLSNDSQQQPMQTDNSESQ